MTLDKLLKNTFKLSKNRKNVSKTSNYKVRKRIIEPKTKTYIVKAETSAQTDTTKSDGKQKTVQKPIIQFNKVDDIRTSPPLKTKAKNYFYIKQPSGDEFWLTKMSMTDNPVKVSCTCLDKNTQILMDNFTYKKIKDIQIGEKVVSHTGQLRTVLATINKKHTGKVYKYIFDNGTKIIASDDHEFLIEENNTEIWKADLEIGDLVYTPEQTIPTNNYLKVTVDLFFIELFAAYFVLGKIVHSSKFKKDVLQLSGIGNTLYKEEVQVSIKKLAKELGVYEFPSDNVVNLCQQLYDKKTNRFTSLFMLWDTESLKWFVKFLFLLQPHVEKNGLFLTYPKSITTQLLFIFAKIGIKVVRDKKSLFIPFSGNALYFKAYTPFLVKNILIDDSVNEALPYTKLIDKQIINNYKDNLYDLTVDVDHSFVANGLAVHNCKDFEFTFANANKKKNALYGKPPPPYTPVPGSTRPPRNPKNITGLCKHLIHMTEALKKRGALTY